MKSRTMSPKAKAISIRQKLTELQARLGVPYQNLETAFIIERLVARLVADQNLSENLVFKGGFVGLRVYESNRYTIDLDALLMKANVGPTLARVKERAMTDLGDGVWFVFEEQLDLATQGEYGGIRQTYRAGLGEPPKDLKRAQIVHFDLGIGDPITPEPRKLVAPSLLPKGEEISWSVYPIETIIAEKLHALIVHGNINSRSKDVYDLSVFLPKADAGVLIEALSRCFKFRQTELPVSLSRTVASINPTSLRRGWVGATSSLRVRPDFNETFDFVVKELARLEHFTRMN